MMEIYDLSVRAWDNARNRMFYGVNLYSLGSSGRITHVQVGGQQAMKHVGLDVDLMLWTGICDKNGKKIYKSDLVQTSIGLGKIVFGAYSTMRDSWEVEENSPKFCIEWFDDSEGHSILRSEDVEVVGNIYEHPHLIKGEAKKIFENRKGTEK